MAKKPGRQFPGVGVGAVVRHKGNLLMVRRDGAHGAGTWSIPGGWVEMWEHPFTASEREVLEETGVSVAAVRALDWVDAQHRSEGVHAVTLFVECEWLGGVPRVVEPAKCPEVAWIPFAEVDARPLFEPLGRWWLAHG